MTRLQLHTLLARVALLFAASASLAQDDPCAKLASTAEQSQCVNHQLESAEHDLKLALDAAFRNYTGNQVKEREKHPLPKNEPEKQIRWENVVSAELRASQRTWLKYRESACGTVELTYDGGTFASVAVPLCKTDLTRERTKFLQEYFADHK